MGGRGGGQEGGRGGGKEGEGEGGWKVEVGHHDEMWCKTTQCIQLAGIRSVQHANVATAVARCEATGVTEGAHRMQSVQEMHISKAQQLTSKFVYCSL